MPALAGNGNFRCADSKDFLYLLGHQACAQHADAGQEQGKAPKAGTAKSIAFLAALPQAVHKQRFQRQHRALVQMRLVQNNRFNQRQLAPGTGKAQQLAVYLHCKHFGHEQVGKVTGGIAGAAAKFRQKAGACWQGAPAPGGVAAQKFLPPANVETRQQSGHQHRFAAVARSCTVCLPQGKQLVGKGVKISVVAHVGAAGNRVGTGRSDRSKRLPHLRLRSRCGDP